MFRRKYSSIVNNLLHPKMLGNYQRGTQSKHEIFLKYSFKKCHILKGLTVTMARIFLLQFHLPCHGVLFSWRNLQENDVMNNSCKNLHSTLWHCKVGGPSTCIVHYVSSSWWSWKQMAFSTCWNWGLQRWVWTLTTAYSHTQPVLKGIQVFIWEEDQNFWKQIWGTCVSGPLLSQSIRDLAAWAVFIFSLMSSGHFVYIDVCTLTWQLVVILVKFRNWLQWK